MKGNGGQERTSRTGRVPVGGRIAWGELGLEEKLPQSSAATGSGHPHWDECVHSPESQFPHLVNIRSWVRCFLSVPSHSYKNLIPSSQMRKLRPRQSQ